MIKRCEMQKLLADIIASEEQKVLEPDTYQHGHHFGVVDTCRILLEAIEKMPDPRTEPKAPNRVFGDHRIAWQFGTEK